MVILAASVEEVKVVVPAVSFIVDNKLWMPSAIGLVSASMM